MKSIPADVEKFRSEYRKNEVGRYYSDKLHFSFTFLFSTSIMAFSLWKVNEVQLLEWAAIPLTFLYANVVEYFFHKWPMHRPIRFLEIIFQRHTLQHHHFYTSDAMEWSRPGDFKMILFPPVLLVAFIVVFSFPASYFLSVIFSSNVAFLFLFVAVGYYLNYELLHTVYHLPESSWVYRLLGLGPVLRSMSRIHTLHHDKGLMTRYNFNITYPICDLVFKTYFRG